ncbi:MAG: hypothetical protein ACKVPX_07440 [Myxococcaceae bacterium]
MTSPLRWLPLVLALSACNQQVVSPPAQVQGSYDLAQVGDLLFVTAAGRNELKVLDLVLPANTRLRTFVRAPNPIKALSIPVLERPIQLVRDTTWVPAAAGEDAGGEISGPYLYVRGEGSAEVSWVDGRREGLRELGRIIAPSTVTALAASGPTQTSDSRLYIATLNASIGVLYRVAMPSPEAVASGATPGVLDAVLSVPDEAITALAILPDDELAIATRSLVGGASRAFVLHVPTLATRALLFGKPVRHLVTHARVAGGPGPAAFLYGVVDEQACGAPTDCQGILAVRRDTGALATVNSGQPMSLLGMGSGLIQSLVVAPGMEVRVTADDAAPVPVPLLGMVATAGSDSVDAGGRIFFFHALEMRHFVTVPDEPNDQPLSFGVDPGLVPNFFLPGGAVLEPSLGRAFVAYPSAGGMMEFDPATITPNALNSREITPYR